MTIRKAFHGAAGVAKAITGTGGTDQATIDRRAAICGKCEHAKLGPAGLIERCELCGCLTWAKIRNADEKCPAGKW